MTDLPFRPTALALLGLLGFAAQAAAHAILLDSAPAEGASLPAGHAEFRLRFNSRIDRARSRVSLAQGGEGGALPLGDAGRPDVLLCGADLAPGPAVLRWQVLAVDGHITRGAVHFTVLPAER